MAPWDLDNPEGDPDYVNTLNDGPPFMADDPDPEHQAELTKWRQKVTSARDKFKTTTLAHVTDGFSKMGLTTITKPDAPIGHPELDVAFKGLSDLGVIDDQSQLQQTPTGTKLPSLMPHKPLKPQQVVIDPSPNIHIPSDVEENPFVAGQMETQLKGLSDTQIAAALRVYTQTKQDTGDQQEATRRMLVAKQIISGNVSQDAWMLMEADAFGDPEAGRTNRNTPIFKEFQAMGALPPSPVEGESDPLRVSVLNAYLNSSGPGGKPVSPQDKQYLLGLYSDALKGQIRWSSGDEQVRQPATPAAAFDAFKQGLRELYGNTKAVGPLALSPEQAALQYGPSLALGVILPGVGPAAMIGLQLAGEGATAALPEGTPDYIKTGIEFGLYGLAGKGTLAEKALEGVKLGVAASAGGEAAKAVGVTPVVGQFIAPILTPSMALVVRRQIGWMAAAHADGKAVAGLSDVLARSKINLEPTDIGKMVAFGDQLGTVTSFAGRDLLNVTLDNGMQVIIHQGEAMPLPGTGFGATMTSEAERLRLGQGIGDHESPFMTTPQAMADADVSKVMVHFTPEGNAASIMRDGFKPTEASDGTLPGVYVREQPNEMQALTYGNTHDANLKGVSWNDALSSGRGVFTKVPNGPVATEEQVTALMRERSLRYSKDDMSQVVRELQSRGFVGAEWGEPGAKVFFDPKALKPTVASSVGTSWDDFMAFAKGVIDGSARVSMMPNAAGGAFINGLSKEANALVDHVTTSAYDRRIWQIMLAGGAQPKELPKTWLGQRWLFVRSGLGYNPGLRRIVQPQFLSSASGAEARQVRIAIQEETIQKALREAFSPDVVKGMEAGESPLRSIYHGPDFSGQHADSVIGSFADAAEHPEHYHLTQTQAEVLQLYSGLMDNNAAYLRDVVGVDQKLIEGAYVPHLRPEEEASGLMDRFLNLEPSSSRARGSAQRPFFRKERNFQDLREWADFLGKTGEKPELNLYKLMDARLQSAARLEADQGFLQSVAKAYGQPIENPKAVVSLRADIAKAKNQLRGRLTTSIRQEVRGTTQYTDLKRMDNLVRDTEKALDAVDNSLATASPITGQRFAELEGALQALDRESDLIAGSAQKLDEAAMATDGRLATTKMNIADIRQKIKDLQAKVSVHTNAVAPPGWTEIGVGRLKTRTAVPEDVAREVNTVMAPTPEGDWINKIESGMQWLRSTLLSSDASFYTKQGYDLWTLDPLKGVERMVNASVVATSREGFVTWAAQNYDALTRYINAGGTFYMAATDAIKSLDRGSKFNLPLSAKIDEFGFHRMLPVYKVMQWQSQVQLLTNLQNDKAGLGMVLEHIPGGDKLNTLAQRFGGLEYASHLDIEKAAADVVADVGGGINWNKLMTRPDLLQGAVMLTPGWLRANVGRIVNAARIGDPRGVLARRFFFQNIATTAMLSTVSSMALSGRMPNLDPTSSDFLDIQVGPEDQAGKGGTVPILPDKSYVRTIFRAIMGESGAFGSNPNDIDGAVPDFLLTDNKEIDNRVGALLTFGSGRMAQLPRLGIDLANGHDIFGRKIDNPLMYAARSFLPIAGQGALDLATHAEGSSAAGVAMGAVGLNFVPRNPYETRDAYVANDPKMVDPVDGSKLTTYGSLTETMRADFDKTHPAYTDAVVKYQDERDSPFAVLRAVRDEHRAAVEALGQAFMGQPLSDQQRALFGDNADQIVSVKGDTVAYRKLLSALSDQYRQKADTASSSSVDFAPTSTAQKIVSDYYTQVVDASGGGKGGPGLDFTKMDANERTYRRNVLAQYGQAGVDVLDSELLYRSSDDPVAQAYHKDQTVWNPYFDYLDSFWSKANLVSAGFTDKAADTALKLPNSQQYQSFLSESYKEQLIGKPLPSNIMNYASGSGASIGERWGIIPGRRLTEQQAQDIGEELTRIQMKNYSDRISAASDSYLIKNSDALCAMSYWGITEPSAATRPYLTLCTRSRIQ